jgi:hypothetical protein
MGEMGEMAVECPIFDKSESCFGGFFFDDCVIRVQVRVASLVSGLNFGKVTRSPHRDLNFIQLPSPARKRDKNFKGYGNTKYIDTTLSTFSTRE